MGGKGGGTKIPEFVKESHKMMGERSKQLYDLSSPVMGEGVQQLQSLLTTGGPGAQVPIIANMETGQQRAFNTANRQIEETMARGAGAAPRDPSFNRISELQNQDFQANLNAIAPRIAGPMIMANMGQALGGGALAQQGYQSAAQALASGVRRPEQRSSGGGLMDAFKQFGSMYASGGFNGMFGGGATGAAFKDWTSTQPFRLDA